jgi:hypothetical protein
VTKGIYLTAEYFEDRLMHASDHIQWFEANVRSVKGAKTFELGCGWYPVVPLSMFLKGAGEIYSIDISRLMNKETLKTTLESIVRYEEEGKLSKYYTPLPEKMEVLKNVLKNYDHLSYEEILKTFNFTYLVEDLTELSAISEGYIDLTHSNNTFEHVYPVVLKGILRKFIEIGKIGKGCHSHFVDMSDHFAHFDKTINIYNFLQFSAKRWDKIDNSIQPQNRYRMSDYEKLYQELNIPISHVTKRKGSLEDLAKVDLSEEYNGYEKADLAISHCHIYSVV